MTTDRDPSPLGLTEEEIGELVSRVNRLDCFVADAIRSALALQRSRIVEWLHAEAECPVDKDTAGKRKALHTVAARLEREGGSR